MNIFTLLSAWFWVLLVFGCAQHNQGVPPSEVQPIRVVIAEGQAAINNGSRLLARKLALQDAIRQAALQAGAQVKSQTSVNLGVVQQDRFTVHAAAAVTSTQVLDENIDAGVLSLRAKVTLASEAHCKSLYRKRLLATAFPLAEPSHLGGAESQDIVSGIPRELNNLLQASHAFIGLDATQTSLFENPKIAPNLGVDDLYKSSKVMQIAAANGVQLVLAGVVRDLQIEASDYIVGSGPMAMAKSLLHDVWSRRGIGLDIYIYDGFSGALLLQNRYTDIVAGDVWIPEHYEVGSERFNATETGAKIAAMIAQANTDIQQALNCYPFVSRISKIVGDKVYIDAGSAEQLQVGDQFIVYADAVEDLRLDGTSHWLEDGKQPVGVVTLEQVNSRYAVGSLDVDSNKVGLKVGDWVQSW